MPAPAAATAASPSVVSPSPGVRAGPDPASGAEGPKPCMASVEVRCRRSGTVARVQESNLPDHSAPPDGGTGAGDAEPGRADAAPRHPTLGRKRATTRARTLAASRKVVGPESFDSAHA